MLIFENKGDVVGVSNPHPHGQIYATNFVFKTIETEAAAGRRYFEEHGRVLFQDILRSEHEDGRRILFENASPWSSAVFRPLRLRVLCRAESDARQPGDAVGERASRIWPWR